MLFIPLEADWQTDWAARSLDNGRAETPVVLAIVEEKYGQEWQQYGLGLAVYDAERA